MSSIDNSWIFDIQDKIYSRLDAEVTAELSSKYADITVTMDSHLHKNPKFPNVFLHFLAPVELGNDLDGQDINAIYLTAEIIITVTNAQTMLVANEVSQVVTSVMKNMRFVATLPEFVDTDSEYRTVSRFARTIGNEDTLYEV